MVKYSAIATLLLLALVSCKGGDSTPSGTPAAISPTGTAGETSAPPTAIPTVNPTVAARIALNRRSSELGRSDSKLAALLSERMKLQDTMRTTVEDAVAASSTRGREIITQERELVERLRAISITPETIPTDRQRLIAERAEVQKQLATLRTERAAIQSKTPLPAEAANVMRESYQKLRELNEKIEKRTIELESASPVEKPQ